MHYWPMIFRVGGGVWLWGNWRLFFFWKDWVKKRILKKTLNCLRHWQLTRKFFFFFYFKNSTVTYWYKSFVVSNLGVLYVFSFRRFYINQTSLVLPTMSTVTLTRTRTFTIFYHIFWMWPPLALSIFAFSTKVDNYPGIRIKDSSLDQWLDFLNKIKIA